MAMLDVTLIAPLAGNPAFLDPYRFRNLIRMVPDDRYQVQVSSFNYFVRNSLLISWNTLIAILIQRG